MENKEKNFVSAVIYVHENERQIARFLKKINGLLQENFEHYEIICVDDRSLDGSVSRIKEFAEGTEGVSVSILHMSYYQGVEPSMNAGMDLAIGDFVFEFDKVTEEFPEELLMEVYRTSLTGFDIVSAAPEKAEKWSSRLFYKVYNRAAQKQTLLRSETFRILSRRAINRVYSMSQSIPYRKALYANCGLQTKTLTYALTGEPSKGLAREEKAMRMDMAVNSLILFTDLGYRFSAALAGLMMLAALLIGVYTVIVFVSAKPVEGWTTTMLFLSLAFFGVFAIFAIIIKYLSILLNLTFTRQRYVMEGIEKVR